MATNTQEIVEVWVSMEMGNVMISLTFVAEFRDFMARQPLSFGLGLRSFGDVVVMNV